jgi:hypothetical protein
LIAALFNGVKQESAAVVIGVDVRTVQRAFAESRDGNTYQIYSCLMIMLDVT